MPNAIDKIIDRDRRIAELEAKLARADEEITARYLAGRMEVAESAEAELEEARREIERVAIERNANDANIAIILRALGVETVDDAVQKIAAAEAQLQVALERKKDAILVVDQVVAKLAAAEAKAQRYRGALQAIEKHHITLNMMAGRDNGRSSTLRLARAALAPAEAPTESHIIPGPDGEL